MRTIWTARRRGHSAGAAAEASYASKMRRFPRLGLSLPLFGSRRQATTTATSAGAGAGTGGRAGRRLSLSFSSWFCVPEQGMKDFEILNRASAFLVRSRAPPPTATTGARTWAPSPYPKVHVLTASHVVAPWKWPKYYPDDWLQFVNEKHTTYTAESRHDDGIFATQCELRPVSYHHGTRDLAVLHLDNEDEVLELLDEIGVDVLQLSPVDAPAPQEGSRLEFHGHQISGNDLATAGAADDLRKSIPRVCVGVIKGRTERQVFAQTTPVLSQGMCGGPVVLSSSSGGGGGAVAVGLVEGIVPHDHAVSALQSLAVFVESKEVQEFLQAVESGTVEPLIGGESIRVVSQDKDESKMDLQRILDDDNEARPPPPSSSSPTNNFSFKKP